MLLEYKIKMFYSDNVTWPILICYPRELCVCCEKIEVDDTRFHCALSEGYRIHYALSITPYLFSLNEKWPIIYNFCVLSHHFLRGTSEP